MEDVQLYKMLKRQDENNSNAIKIIRDDIRIDYYTLGRKPMRCFSVRYKEFIAVKLKNILGIDSSV